MSWRVTYRSKWSGKTVESTHNTNRSDAEGWTKSLAQENNCKATCVEIADGPYDYSKKVTHILTVGDDDK